MHYFSFLTRCAGSNIYQGFLQEESKDKLRASSPIWASEVSLARKRERAAKPRGAEERRACNDLS